MNRSRLALSTLLAAFLLASSASGGTAQAAGDSAPIKANPADVASVGAIIAAVYDVISGPAGDKRDWDRFRSLFMEGARLIGLFQSQEGGLRPTVMTPEDYVQRAGPMLERDGFFEAEIGRTTERFGPVAHAFSSYESKRKKDDPKPFDRGINSIQLMHDGERWWVVTIYWTGERPDLPIPEKYIGKGEG